MRKIIFLSLFLFLTLSTVTAQESNQTEYLTEIDPSTRIIDVEWESSKAHITVESDIPRIITLTDIGSISSSGASQVNFKQVSIASGRSTVEMEATPNRGNQKLTIVAGDSMIALSSPSEPILERVTRTHFYIGLILASISTVLQTLLRQKWTDMRLKRGLRRIA